MLVGTSAYIVWMSLFKSIDRPFGDADFAQQWFAARVLWAGGQPYAAVGPGRSFEWPSALVYPLTALVVVSPFAWLSKYVAEATFAAFAAAAMAFAITRRSFFPLLVFASQPYVVALSLVQWSPLLTAAALLPGIAWVVVAKPTIGVAVAVYRPTRRWVRGATIGGTVVLATSLLLRPTWVPEWIAATRELPSAVLGSPAGIDAMYLSPLTCPGGWLILLALFRWRRPEARLLVALAAVPQTMANYELVLVLALVPRTPIQAVGLVLGSWVSWFYLMLGWPYASWNAVFQAAGQFSVWFVLLPATALVLTHSDRCDPPRGATSSEARPRQPDPRILVWLRERGSKPR